MYNLQNHYTQLIHGKTHPIGPKVRNFFIILDGFKNVFNSFYHTFFVKGLGVNTNLGLRQTYELGQYLRERYQSILGDDKFSESRVYVQSETLSR